MSGADHCRQRPFPSCGIGGLGGKRTDSAPPGVAERGRHRFLASERLCGLSVLFPDSGGMKRLADPPRAIAPPG